MRNTSSKPSDINLMIGNFAIDNHYNYYYETLASIKNLAFGLYVICMHTLTIIGES